MKKNILRTLLLLLLVLSICVSASAAIPQSLVPVGEAIGLKLQTDGVYVVRTVERSPAQQAGVRQGDIIRRVNGTDVTSVQELVTQVERSTGKVTLDVEHNGSTWSVRVQPEQTPDGRRLGAQVRDGVTGVGTVTFYDPQTNTYGALGHGVSIAQSETLLSLTYGTALDTQITQIIRGQKGRPGALRGALEQTRVRGSIAQNTNCGIFGEAADTSWSGAAIPVAYSDEICVGSAGILSTVCEQTKSYSVEILAVYPEERSGRNMLLEITDDALLQTTGGIVQGMSGSPIIQNGKLVGAITHVLVEDPTKGYGIFIRNMLEASKLYDD